MNYAVRKAAQEHKHSPEVQAEKQGWLVITTREVMADGAQAPGFVTLCRVKVGEYAVHFFNSQDGGFHNGKYTKSAADGVSIFAEKAERFTRHHARLKK